MGRGKVKYRDVVGGSKKKPIKKNKKKWDKKKPNRKTYSLYKQDHKKSNNYKRKLDHEIEDQEEKKVKVEKSFIAEESSESEVENDQMQQLRETFSSKLTEKHLFAVDSSEDSVEEEEEVSDKECSESIPKLPKLSDDEEQEEGNPILEDVVLEEDTYDDANDPFVKHLFYDLAESVLNSLQNVPPLLVETVQHWTKLGRLIVQIPQYKELDKSNTKAFSIEEDKKFAPPASVPKNLKNLSSNTAINHFIKNQIVNNISKANTIKTDEFLNDFQSELFSIMNNYQDLYFTERTLDNGEQIRFVYCLHAINHILKTRLKIVHHNSRLAHKDDVPDEFRDQGLVRPKILIVAPFKDSAYKIVQMIINILLPEVKGHVMNKTRFLEEYTGNEIVMPKKNPKPEDYEITFSGNTSDDFKIGITFTKKSLKLYADFYSSDIIIASPLGLRTIIGAEGETERNYDFLASIELLILDQTELFFMQNWDHLMHIFNHIHLQPKESHGTDFSRVRNWSLNGWSKYYRQTLIFSSVVLPEINAIFNKKCTNHAGKIRVSNPIEFGTIRQVFVQVPHVFHKFETANAQQLVEARFEFFLDKILPQQRDSLMKQTLIFVSSYFDFVRLRNYFKKEELSFVQICEYSKDSKVARARDMFFHGDVHFMLYTERHHFFNRIRIKGIRHLVFYEVPVFPHFYYEICNLMQEANMNKKVGSMSNMSVNVMYSKYDIHRIAAIVGTERASKMVQSERNVHMMVTGAD